MADRIVQPKVLASQNPDTYDNLIIQQAQNASNVTNSINGNALSDIFESNGTTVKNATNAANGIFMQSFSNWNDFASWMMNNENCLFFDITFNSSYDISNCRRCIITPSNGTTITENASIILSYVYRFKKSGCIFTDQDSYIANQQLTNTTTAYSYTITLSHSRASSRWTLNGNLMILDNSMMSYASIPFNTVFSPTNITISAYYTNN